MTMGRETRDVGREESVRPLLPLSRRERGGVPSGSWGEVPLLAVLLLALADDELVIGWSDSEWTGIAPVLEEDVAMSSIAQDEIGHALAFFELLSAEAGGTPDEWAFQREPAEYRCARLVGRGHGDWTRTMARRFLYETADAVRLISLEQSSFAPLANLVAKMRREEQYHLMHVQTWFERFAAGPDEGRERFAAAIADLWPDALDLFAPLDGEDDLVRDGVLPEPIAALRERWQAMLAPSLERLGVDVSAARAPGQPRRGGEHPDFAWLHNEMTMVARLEPGATW
ncbi:MAG TPA: phenylacetate-CoA oxygenase subunit PaaC [Thermomicrobiales bacterium]|nr:phenylacetate-CoA oxygenase subunit PaaC [Thermomicrobiales bacterium]